MVNENEQIYYSTFCRTPNITRLSIFQINFYIYASFFIFVHESRSTRMKLKKLLTHRKNRTVWRLMLNNESILLIEERDLAQRQVFFQCFDITSGGQIIADLQLQEKFWTGVEAFRGDIIYFHGYRKPDMPWHQGISAYSVSQKKIIWENADYIFAFFDENILYGMQQEFESTKYYAVNPLTGELLGEEPHDETFIKQRRSEAQAKADYSLYNFPVQFTPESKPLLDPLISDGVQPGETVVEYLATESLLLVTLQRQNTPATYDQRLVGIVIPAKKVIFNEIINANQKTALFDSFFIFKDKLILINNKEKVIVYSFIN